MITLAHNEVARKQREARGLTAADIHYRQTRCEPMMTFTPEIFTKAATTPKFRGLMVFPTFQRLRFYVQEHVEIDRREWPIATLDGFERVRVTFDAPANQYRFTNGSLITLALVGCDIDINRLLSLEVHQFEEVPRGHLKPEHRAWCESRVRLPYEPARLARAEWERALARGRELLATARGTWPWFNNHEDRIKELMQLDAKLTLVQAYYQALKETGEHYKLTGFDALAFTTARYTTQHPPCALFATKGEEPMEITKERLKKNKFYVGSIKALRDNWGHATLADATKHATEMIQNRPNFGPETDEPKFIVKIVRVVRKKAAPVVVEDVK